MLLWRTFVLLTFLAGEISAKAMPCAWSQEPDPASGNKYRWVIPVPDPCLCTSVGLGPLNTRAPCRPFSVTYYDSFFISNDPEEIRKLLNCQCDSASGSSEKEQGTRNCPTGIRLLPNGTISAGGSSDSSRGSSGEDCDRWYKSTNSQEIQVKFTSEVYITGVATKRKHNCNSNGSVEKFQVQYSLNGESFRNVTKDNGKPFLGNITATDNNATFETVLHASSIKILRVDFSTGCTMCFQLYGCNKP